MRGLWLLCLVACGGGGDGGKDGATVDGPPRDAAPDAPTDAPTAVRRVDCPAQPNATVTTSGFMFTPMNITIKANEIVRFAPASEHNVIPHPTKPSDPGLRTGQLGEVRCLQFTTTGTYNYRCQPHGGMEGSVQVTN